MNAKIKTDKMRLHETFHVAAMLAIVGGFLDAYTYQLRGGVFANAQTGNMVLLGVHLSEGAYARAAYCMVPIAAFALGVLVTEAMRRNISRRDFAAFEHLVIIIEIVLLVIVGFLPLTVPNGVVNVSISFVCSLQANSFRKIKGMTYASTMCTGNLRSGMEKISICIFDKKEEAGREALHYFGIILLFIFGAAIGAVLTNIIGTKSVWCCAVLLAIIFSLLCYKKPKL